MYTRLGARRVRQDGSLRSPIIYISYVRFGPALHASVKSAHLGEPCVQYAIVISRGEPRLFSEAHRVNGAICM